MSGSRAAGKPAALNTSTQRCSLRMVFWPAAPMVASSLAVAVERGLHERHAERAARRADRLLQPFGIERVEHEQDGAGRAATQRGQHGVRLSIEQRDDQQVVRRRFIERIEDPDDGALAVRVDDPVVPLQLLQPDRSGTGDGRDLVLADPRQSGREGAADLPRAEHGDLQRGRWSRACARRLPARHPSIDVASSAGTPTAERRDHADADRGSLRRHERLKRLRASPARCPRSGRARSRGSSPCDRCRAACPARTARCETT